jgi:hypothetical protein
METLKNVALEKLSVIAVLFILTSRISGVDDRLHPSGCACHYLFFEIFMRNLHD